MRSSRRIRPRQELGGGAVSVGRPIRGDIAKDILWLQPNGEEMTDEVWDEGDAHALAVRIAGNAADLLDDSGQPVRDNSVLMLFNSSEDPVEFKLPQNDNRSTTWSRLLDSADPEMTSITVRGTYKVQGHGVAVLGDLTRPQRRAETAR